MKNDMKKISESLALHLRVMQCCKLNGLKNMTETWSSVSFREVTLVGGSAYGVDCTCHPIEWTQKAEWSFVII